MRIEENALPKSGADIAFYAKKMPSGTAKSATAAYRCMQIREEL